MAGRRVEVVCYVPSGQEDQSDLSRADYIFSAYDKMKPNFTLILSGNYHSRVIRSDFDSQDPMGMQLSGLDPVSLPVYSTSGDYWACAGNPVPECGIKSIPNQARSLRQDVKISDEVTTGGYHGLIVIEKFTASPPAGMQAESSEVKQ